MNRRAPRIEKAIPWPLSPPTLFTIMMIPNSKPSAPSDNKAMANAISLIGGLLFTMKVPVGSSLIEKVWSTYAMFSSRSIQRRFQLHQKIYSRNSRFRKLWIPKPSRKLHAHNHRMKPDRTPPDASIVVSPCYATITREKQQERRKIRQQPKDASGWLPTPSASYP